MKPLGASKGKFSQLIMQAQKKAQIHQGITYWLYVKFVQFYNRTTESTPIWKLNRNDLIHKSSKKSRFTRMSTEPLKDAK